MIEPSFESIISVENLLQAWKEFLQCKRKRKDMQEFQLHLMDILFDLHNDLKNKSYEHGEYEAFSINDPKPRNIHKASVRDRLLHHAIYRILYPYFDEQFIFDSYSCRKWKGTHKALKRFEKFSRKASFNNTKNLWILKCDVRKFFASIDQRMLIGVLKKHISDANTIWLLEQVINSFYSTSYGKGLPLGNLTSQLLVNIYMNEFDQYVKHILKARYYIRYADDFVVMSEHENVLVEILPKIHNFLYDGLNLFLHPDKVFIKTLESGVDFLGWVHFSDHRLLRTSTKKRMIKNLKNNQNKASLHSYLGLLKHGNTYKLKNEINEIVENFGKKHKFVV